MNQFLINLSLWVGGGLLAAFLALWAIRLLENRMTYYPEPATGITPQDVGLPYKNIQIPTQDREQLAAWQIEASADTGPLVVFFHGNAGTREDRLHNLAILHQAGINVLIFDYRGYGGSTGSPTEPGVILDGLAVFDWAAEAFPGRPVVLFGRSLGGAVAAQVALQRPAAGIILESTFTSAPDMAGRVLPLPGVRWLIRQRFDTLAAVGRLKLPLLVIHGARDSLIPVAMGRKLYEAAASVKKTLRVVPAGDHNDTYLSAGEAYTGWITEFLAEL